MTDHIQSHKTNRNKYNRLEIIQSMFSDHNGIKQAINNRKIAGKTSKHLGIKQRNNPWVKEDVLREHQVF